MSIGWPLLAFQAFHGKTGCGLVSYETDAKAERYARTESEIEVKGYMSENQRKLKDFLHIVFVGFPGTFELVAHGSIVFL